MAGNFAFMKKKGERIKRIPLNEWGKYRRSGWAFSSEEEYNAEQINKPVADDEKEPGKKKSKKKMRRSTSG